MLKNCTLLAKLGFDTEENERAKVFFENRGSRIGVPGVIAKVMAFHWSVHELLLPYKVEFERLSIWASDIVVREGP